MSYVVVGGLLRVKKTPVVDEGIHAILIQFARTACMQQASIDVVLPAVRRGAT